MKIQTINLIRNIAPKQVNFGHNQPSFKSAPIKDTFTLSKKNGEESYYKFLEDCKNKFPNKTVSEVLSTVSMYDDFLGEGKQSRVYRIKGLDDYVVKLSKSEYDYDPKWYEEWVRPYKDDFPSYNFGQAIATVGTSAKILKKVTGEEAGVKNWFAKFEHSTPRTREDAEKILADVVRVAEFPQKAFNKLAREMKFLTSQGIKIDSINPNNLIIDYDKEQISLIDIEKKEYKNVKNTVYDLLVPILDLTSFDEYEELFDEKEMSLFLNSAKTIYKKAMRANMPDDLEADKKFRQKELLTPKGVRELNSVVALFKK